MSKPSDQTQQPCALVRVPDPSADLYETINHIARARMAAMTLGIAPTALTAAFHDWAVHLASAPGKQLKLVHQAMTLGIAPTALTAAFHDWAVHLASAPGKQLKLAHQAMNDIAAIATYATRCGIGADPGACIHPRPHDRRFEGEAWRKWPYNIMAQSFLAQERWWSAALTDVPGETTAHERVADFVVRQVLDTMAPSNFLATNPEVQAASLAQGGQNLLRGAAQFAGDVSRTLSHEKPPEIAAYKVGRDLAITPGKVVFRNRLIELIQYTPTTPTVHAEPILIVPAWIMKYYIFDLSPQNSFVKYLVGQGFSVFMISWLNPDAADRDLSMDDYRTLGIMAASDAVKAITGAPQMHALGYCLGGTLLSIAAAALGRDGDDRFKTVTLLAAQTDFTEAGELTLFINEAQVSYLEDMMWKQGYLSTDQMGGTFRLLRSADLIWSKNVRAYLLGQPMPVFDLLVWNADGTRLPAKMHSQYLRQLFLKNELAEGRYHVGEKTVTVSNIRAPLFVVGTEDDHVAPWRSVYKIHLLADTDVTFVLTAGGHNVGIMSEPGSQNRHYRIAATPADAPYREDHDWWAEAGYHEGSWWVALSDWLKVRSTAEVVPPPMGGRRYKPLCDAPGTYVMQA